MSAPTGFDRFAQRATGQVGSPWFLLLVALAIAAWLPTLVLWDTGSSDLLVDALTNPLSLLLLILLQNTQNRGDSAKDARQDEIEHAFAQLLRHLAEREEDAAARSRLRETADQLLENAAASTTTSSATVETDATEEQAR